VRSTRLHRSALTSSYPASLKPFPTALANAQRQGRTRQRSRTRSRLDQGQRPRHCRRARRAWPHRGGEGAAGAVWGHPACEAQFLMRPFRVRRLGRPPPSAKDHPAILFFVLTTGTCHPEPSELDRYRRCLGMRVPHQHSRVSVATDGSDLRHVQALLEESAYGLVTQIVEPQAEDPRSSP
jgi:hypothetical protein